MGTGVSPHPPAAANPNAMNIQRTALEKGINLKFILPDIRGVRSETRSFRSKSHLLFADRTEIRTKTECGCKQQAPNDNKTLQMCYSGGSDEVVVLRGLGL